MHHADATLGAQVDFRIGQLGHVHRDQAVVDQAEAIQPRQRALAVQLDRIVDLLRGLVGVQVHLHVELVGQHPHPLEVGIVDRIRRMRRERGADQRIGAPLVMQFTGLGEVLVVGLGPGGGEIDDDRADQRAETMLLVDGGLHIAEEVVLVGAGGAAAQHLGDGQGGAVGDEFGADHRRFHRPDVLLQPGHQRQVVGDAAQQGHRVVRVRVDQARHQRGLGAADHLGGTEPCARLGTRQDGHDLAATHGNGMVFQHHRMRLDRNDVTGFDEQVAGFGEVRAIAHAGSLAGGRRDTSGGHAPESGAAAKRRGLETREAGAHDLPKQIMGAPARMRWRVSGQRPALP